MSNPLSIIFNKSLEEGVFPEDMKLADVVPLFKSKDRNECTNYRPISLLLTISKLLEKIVYRRTYKFLERHDNLYMSASMAFGRATPVKMLLASWSLK